MNQIRAPGQAVVSEEGEDLHYWFARVEKGDLAASPVLFDSDGLVGVDDVDGVLAAGQGGVHE